VAGYDLPKLVTGALGTLGVITRAVFRLHPAPRSVRTLSISPASTEQAQNLILEIQGSKLAHTALQARFAGDTKPRVDILFEGTDAGLAAQDLKLRTLVHTAEVQETLRAVWNARQELWPLPDGLTEPTAIAKLSVLPSSIAGIIRTVMGIADANQLHWKMVMQATGVGWLDFKGAPAALHAALLALRRELQPHGSLTVLRRPAKMPALEVWGDPGDALPLMRAVKYQLDAKNTLNPGRFVGSI
jgi:glycolate oxidase FAD binding subunit